MSANEADFDLREISPLSRNILYSREINALADTGQRTDLKLSCPTTGHRGWLSLHTSPKVSAGNLIYPADVRDSAKSGLGHMDNRHLHYLVESISVNVGGSHQNAKASSLPMSAESVGGSIVVRGWESQPHGEGSQEFDIPLYLLTASSVTSYCERERDDKSESNLGSETPNSGEPGAVKVARPVRKGE